MHMTVCTLPCEQRCRRVSSLKAGSAALRHSVGATGWPTARGAQGLGYKKQQQQLRCLHQARSCSWHACNQAQGQRPNASHGRHAPFWPAASRMCSRLKAEALSSVRGRQPLIGDSCTAAERRCAGPSPAGRGSAVILTKDYASAARLTRSSRALHGSSSSSSTAHGASEQVHPPPKPPVRAAAAPEAEGTCMHMRASGKCMHAP